MSIMQYNGGCCIAMAGKNCFAIASDRRFGQQQMTISCDYSKVRAISSYIAVGGHVVIRVATDRGVHSPRYPNKRHGAGV